MKITVFRTTWIGMAAFVSTAIAGGVDENPAANHCADRRAALDQIDRSTWKLKTEKDVCGYVSKVMGLDPQTDAASMKAHLEEAREDDTPFLDAQVNGSTLWHVIVTGCRLKFCAEKKPPEQQRIWIFDVFVDAKQAHLVKILSQPHIESAALALSPSASAAAKQMLKGDERYVGFPEDAPDVSFLEALETVATQGVGPPPCRGNGILAHYVMQSRMHRGPSAIWAITTQSVSASVVADGSLTWTVRDQMRNIVDAQSGNWMRASNIPHPPAESGQKRRTVWPRPSR